MTRLVLGSHNVNGIRAAMRRGFRQFWDAENPGVIALQEVRCRLEDLPGEAFAGHHTALETGTLAGRNGVAVMTRQPPAAIRSLSGTALLAGPDGVFTEVPTVRLPNRDLAHFAHEGRYVEVDLADSPIRVASLYLPKGAAWPHEVDGKDKYDRKMRFLKGLSRLLTSSRREAAAAGREFVVVGDFNIAHTRLDLKNWRTNQRSEGFLPEEREWFGSVVGPRRLVDVVRHVHPGVDGPYSWWSWRGQSFLNDVGWRIDYHLASPSLARSATRAWVAREADYESRISDHSPVLVEYDLGRLPELTRAPGSLARTPSADSPCGS